MSSILHNKQGAPTDAEMRHAITNWVSVLIRGITLANPVTLKLHGHRDRLYIQAGFPKVGVVIEEGKKLGPDEIETIDLVLYNTPNYTFTPGSAVREVDFKNEWPPVSMIKEQLQPKIVMPDGKPASVQIGTQGIVNEDSP